MEIFDPQFLAILAKDPRTILLLMAWVLPWKAVSLWKSARLGHKKWFIAMILLNTLAILDIIYIFAVARKAEKKESSDN